MPDLSLFKVPGAILAHARNLILGDWATAPLERAANRDQGMDPAKPDKSFWASVAAADRRLADLRRAIAEAEAAIAATQVSVEALPGVDPRPGESRCEAAQRVITDALGAEKS
jgi:hypothetical protein